VTLVATALCADRAVSAAAPSSLRPESTVMSMAGRLVRRLSSNFRRVVPSLQLLQSLRISAVVSQILAIAPDHAFVPPLRLSPFNFRLPPPSL